MSQEEPSDRKLDPSLFSMAGHARLKFIVTECSKTQIRLTRPIWHFNYVFIFPTCVYQFLFQRPYSQLKVKYGHVKLEIARVNYIIIQQEAPLSFRYWARSSEFLSSSILS